MEGARLLDGLITTEFSFIQELIWTPPHKNPFPLCSHSILSRLKKLRGESLRASPTTRQLAVCVVENLDADIKILVELRKRCLKLLACKDSTADGSTSTSYLAKEVDSILVQHLENSWKEPSFNLTDTDVQQQNNIDQDVLAADVLQLFVLDSSQQWQRRNKDGIAEANCKVLEVDCQDDIVSYMPRSSNTNLTLEIIRTTELRSQKQFSPQPGQSSSSSGEHSTAVSIQEAGFHILTIETVKGAAMQSATEATVDTRQEVMGASNADANSFKRSSVEKEHCVFPLKLSVTKSSKCDSPKAVVLSTSMQAQSALASHEGPDLSIITPEAVNDAGRGTIVTSECFPPTDEGFTATSEAKPNQFFQETEDAVEQVVTQLEESPSCFTTDEYFSASSDDEYDSMIETSGTKNSDGSQIPKSAIVNGAATLTRENASEISEVEHFPPGAGHVAPREIQIFSRSRDADGAPKMDVQGLRESPLGGIAGIKDDEVKSKFAGNCSNEELVEVEMTLRAKICEPESEEPYWHVMFALLNYSNFKVSVQKLEYWSHDKQEDVKCIHWPPGEMILREQPSFLCHSIKVPCSASNTSPRLAFSWQYSKLPEWIPTKDGRPKIEKGTIRKRLGNMLSFGATKKTLKHDMGPLSSKSTKKRTA